MIERETEELIEKVLEGLESPAALEGDEARRELEAAAELDKLIGEALRREPLPPCPARLREFRFRAKRSVSFSRFAWVAAAAAVLVVGVLALLYVRHASAPPEADARKLEALLAKAGDDTLPPPELREAQGDFVRLLADNYGSLAELEKAGRMPDLDAVWLRSCRRKLDAALDEARGKRSPGDRLAVIEEAIDDCRGFAGEAAIGFYRETLASSKRLMDESIAAWADGGRPELSWASGVWRPFGVVMSGENAWRSREVRLAWRAVADGAESAEIAARFDALPRRTAAELAAAAAAYISRDARYHPALVGTGDILGPAAEAIETSLMKRGQGSGGAFANFTVMPLWTSFFVRKDVLPARVRVRFSRIEHFFDGLNRVMGRKGINPRFALNEIRAALRADDLYLLNIRKGASEWRLARLYNEAASVPAERADDWRSVLNAVNLLRFLRGRKQISTVFHHPAGAEEAFLAALDFKTVLSAQAALRALLLGDFDRVHPVFSGEGVTLRLFREGGGPAIPDNHNAPAPPGRAEPTSGDFPGRF